ncbi:AraC family transcriptional regulator [Fumia xinanensis]|uniref:Helix-turn-helix transcriptional regulator n=1 Tax=Fumia xinanensis TaxID=2763659 RepID=A0A926I7A2_9FIRM|nr:AraC family transcriptional regulator [Fumia xinanensis]MBC8559637.1 helix-turn-helix transcriptional regulator [Fumia xinanensis]
MPQEISAFNPSQMMIRTDFEAYHYREPHFHSLDFHSHDFYELYVFLDGSVTYYIEEKVYDLCTGDLLLIPPGKMHRPVLIENAPIYERIVLWINSGFLHSLGGGFVRCFADAEERKNFLCRPSPQSFRYLRETLSRLIRCMQLKEVLKRAYLTAALEEISHSFRESPFAGTNPVKQEIIPAVIAYIDEHYTEPLTLDQICGAFFVSKYHLSRRFKAYTNSTVYDYILSKRVSLARRLIRQGVSASDAGEKCGFSDYSNFYKAFVRKTGLSPSRFKETVSN